ncbi:hypothetical protein BDP27DRAFT_1413783 [Rhodocollybia butyracea]|uniref:F-box domain-containing protein n=1 Tax=Rhodocollybia butyracea TaxID=206335 RepID=A0A9P5QAI0_9AGAR|nr:hypothetical protein BDP27DRAFT_1413783 [Rhodocollybia butyracea]
MQVFRLQDLPIELERDIFEIAARMDLQTALNLSLVCRQLKDWTQPLVYEMVTLGTGDIELFLRTMEMFPPDFFARCVKRLCLTVSIVPLHARTILQACTGITSLACWVDFIDSEPNTLSPFGQLFYPLRLRHLSIETAHFRRLELHECTWIHTLTRLDLIFWRRDSLLISELHLLPALTHLALFIQHKDVENGLTYILSVVPALQVLCLVVDDVDLEYYEHNVNQIDLRVVYMTRPGSVRDWEAAYRGLPDMWSRAEDIVAERRAISLQVIELQ